MMNIKTPRDLGHALRARRKAMALDQGALADRIGVSRKWIVEVEQGKPRAEIGLVLRAFAALGLNLSAGPDQARGADDDGRTDDDLEAVLSADLFAGPPEGRS